jgi:hypothetical protein
MPRRFVAAGIHLLVSVCVAAMAAGVVFLIWYPSPFGAIAGGLGLFTLLVSIDVILGPTLTAVVASPGKPLGELRRDLAVIVVIQIAAFAYGIWSIAFARPVYISYEIDRFRVVSAADVDRTALAEAPTALRSLPWLGPKLIAAVKPTDPNEQLRSIDLGLAGFDLSMVPKYWREYSTTDRAAAWKAARPIDSLLAKYPQQAATARDIASHAGQDVKALRFLPLLSRRASWSAVVAAPDARIVGYLPVDGFI